MDTAVSKIVRHLVRHSAALKQQAIRADLRGTVQGWQAQQGMAACQHSQEKERQPVQPLSSWSRCSQASNRIHHLLPNQQPLTQALLPGAAVNHFPPDSHAAFTLLCLSYSKLRLALACLTLMRPPS